MMSHGAITRLFDHKDVTVNGFIANGLLQSYSLDCVSSGSLVHDSVHSCVFDWTWHCSLIFEIFKRSAVKRTQAASIEIILAP